MFGPIGKKRDVTGIDGDLVMHIKNDPNDNPFVGLSGLVGLFGMFGHHHCHHHHSLEIVQKVLSAQNVQNGLCRHHDFVECNENINQDNLIFSQNSLTNRRNKGIHSAN